MPRTATNKAEPMMDQRIGKGLPPMLTLNNLGKSRLLAIHMPKKEPMKPKAIDARQPPFPEPAMDLPIPPQMPATMSKTISEPMVISKMNKPRIEAIIMSISLISECQITIR